LTNDFRNYTYDSRRNITNIRGKYLTGGVWDFYDVASAFDAMNRRVFKSFYDETTTKTATWFFYYDALSRLSEVRYTPDTSVSATYSLFQLVWLGDKLVAYWQTDYPSVTTSKRYVSTDEANRPVDMMSWPASGDATRVWTINPDAWGNDKVLVGSSVFQPILFAGQYKDVETVAWQNDGSTAHRPGVVLNGYRTYDPFTGSYLQVDPMVDSTWSTYVYVNSDPVGKKDPSGRVSEGVTFHHTADFFSLTGESCFRDGEWGVEVDSSCVHFTDGFEECGYGSYWTEGCGCIPDAFTCAPGLWPPLDPCYFETDAMKHCRAEVGACIASATSNQMLEQCLNSLISIAGACSENYTIPCPPGGRVPWCTGRNPVCDVDLGTYHRQVCPEPCH
jgi:RHS repeat-associated protein